MSTIGQPRWGRILGPARVWILMAHRQRHEEAAVRAYLDGFGTGEIMMRGTDAVAMLYDLS